MYFRLPTELYSSVLHRSHLYFPVSYLARLGCQSRRKYSAQRSNSIVFSEEEPRVLGSKGRNVDTGWAWVTSLISAIRILPQANVIHLLDRVFKHTYHSPATSRRLLVVRRMCNQPPHTRLLIMQKVVISKTTLHFATA